MDFQRFQSWDFFVIFDFIQSRNLSKLKIKMYLAFDANFNDTFKIVSH